MPLKTAAHLRRLTRMADDIPGDIASDASRSPFDLVDPWAALQDGRRQLLAAIEAAGPRFAARTLTIPEFADLGPATASVLDHLRAQALRDRAHAAFFASLQSGAPPPTPDGTTPPLTREWRATVEEVEAARLAMLEAAAALSSTHWEHPLTPTWPDAVAEPLAAMLLVRAMCDGILAEAIRSLSAAGTDTR